MTGLAQRELIKIISPQALGGKIVAENVTGPGAVRRVLRVAFAG
jgi:hypothetical protein